MPRSETKIGFTEPPTAVVDQRPASPEDSPRPRPSPASRETPALHGEEPHRFPDGSGGQPHRNGRSGLPRQGWGDPPASAAGGAGPSGGVAPLGREWRVLILGLLLCDLVALMAASVAAGCARYRALVLPSGGPELWEQASLVALYALLFWAIGWRNGIYHRDNLLGGPGEYERVFQVGIYTPMAVMVAGQLMNLPAMPRVWWVAYVAAAALFACLIRFGLRRVAYRLRDRGLFTTRVLIAGANDQGIAIARQLSGSRRGFEVVGFLDDYAPTGTRVALEAPWEPVGVHQGQAGGDICLQVLGGTNQLGVVAWEQSVQEVIVIPHAVSWEGLQTLVASRFSARDGLRIHLSAGLYDMVTANMTPTQRGLVPLLTLGSKRLTGLDAILKWGFDRALAGLLLLCLLPLLSATVLFGWLRGVRPALEWETVLGMGGCPVRVPMLHQTVTRRLLPRGLPALLAVLEGRLSLVGPRPIALHEVPKYGEWTSLLVAMRPGLTGYWRLLAGRPTLEEAVAWDLWYLRNYSIWTDLFLLFQTARASLRIEGGSAGGALRRWECKVSGVDPVE